MTFTEKATLAAKFYHAVYPHRQTFYALKPWAQDKWINAVDEILKIKP